MISDGQGGAIIAWTDDRGHTGDIFVYAQRIDGNGAAQWTLDGVKVSGDADDADFKKLTADGFGGAIISWDQFSSGTFVQRITSTGDCLWEDNGVLLSSWGVAPWPVCDGTGGAIVTWADHRGSDDDIYAQRVSASGDIQWGSSGKVICGAVGGQYFLAMAGGGDTGVVISWGDSRDADLDVYAQRVGVDGSVYWTDDGEPISTALNFQVPEVVVNDGAGGFIIGWTDRRSGVGDSDIYCQRINLSGQLGSPTVHANLTCVPSAGTLPLDTLMSATLTNNYTGQMRRIGARIDLDLANGTHYSNWKAGTVTVGAGESRDKTWLQTIPALVSVVGDTVFTLHVLDITPPPYNQAPYLPDGDTDSDACTVTGIKP